MSFEVIAFFFNKTEKEVNRSEQLKFHSNCFFIARLFFCWLLLMSIWMGAEVFRNCFFIALNFCHLCVTHILSSKNEKQQKRMHQNLQPKKTKEPSSSFQVNESKHWQLFCVIVFGAPTGTVYSNIARAIIIFILRRKIIK